MNERRPAAGDDLGEVLRSAAAGDDMALAVVVEATIGEVRSVCRMLADTGDVDDLVQETYLRAMRSMGSFRSEGTVGAWLQTIARRSCADLVRRRQRERRLLERIEQLRRPGLDPQGCDAVESTELGGLSFLNHLSPDQRDAFVLTQLLDLSYDQAAGIVGCPVGTIRSRVHRARETLLLHVTRAVL